MENYNGQEATVNSNTINVSTDYEPYDSDYNSEGTETAEISNNSVSTSNCNSTPSTILPTITQ